MPRSSRIDTTGALHHIIARGIERRKIFRDNTDRDCFIDRLGIILEESGTRCYAWTLIPNHFHLLLKTGHDPIAAVMRRLMTGYAVSFNRRHCRSGRLFQNRYKSILCQEDAYLKELVRYIHLNPLRAGIVKDFKALGRFRYCGHSVIMGKNSNDWQAMESVLSLFADNKKVAQDRYLEFVQKGIQQGQRPELTGGGLLRSVGGWAIVKSLHKAGVFQKSDERILGDSNFVTTVLADAQEALERKYALASKGIDFEQVTDAVCNLMAIQPDGLIGPGKDRKRGRARSLVCFWGNRELGLPMTEIAGRLKISVPTVSLAVRKGEQLVRQENLSLVDLVNVKI